MGNMNTIFGFILTGCGIYCLYLWRKVRRGGDVSNDSLLVPAAKRMKDCINAEAYLDEISPDLLVFSVLIILFGLFSLADTAFGLIDLITAGMSAGMRLLVLELLTCVIPLGVCIWFMIRLRKLQKRYWV